VNGTCRPEGDRVSSAGGVTAKNFGQDRPEGP
jgi:hypothetical protein